MLEATQISKAHSLQIINCDIYLARGVQEVPPFGGEVEGGVAPGAGGEVVHVAVRGVLGGAQLAAAHAGENAVLTKFAKKNIKFLLSNPRGRAILPLLL